MAKTVNYAGTVLGLNTEKYTKSLNTLKTQSASCANSIKNSFILPLHHSIKLLIH